MLFKVEINASHSELLNWDKPLYEQDEKVQTSIRSQVAPEVWRELEGMTGQAFYNNYLDGFEDPKAASSRLNEWGIKGVRYLDQGSRESEEGTCNLVIFDAKIVKKVPIESEDDGALLERGGETKGVALGIPVPSGRGGCQSDVRGAH